MNTPHALKDREEVEELTRCTPLAMPRKIPQGEITTETVYSGDRPLIHLRCETPYSKIKLSKEEDMFHERGGHFRHIMRY